MPTEPTDTSAPPAAPVAGRSNFVVSLLYGLVVLVALCIALYGAWVATSLAVYHDGPVWLAIVGAVTCFFLIPLGWELLADRQQQGGRVRDAILRSSFLSLVFLVVLLVTHPATAFKALATRGDWFLGGSTSPAAESVRGVLHTLGDGLEGLYDLARTQLFDEDPETAAITPAPQPPVSPGATPQPAAAAATRVGLPIPGSSLTWPLPATPHATLSSLPDEAGASIEALGAHFAATLPDLFERTRAVHDFVATTVSYDVALLRALDGGADYPRITPDKVFEARRSICEGYARLLIALGKAAGLHIVRVTGDTRSIADYEGLASADVAPVLDGRGHAWNAVEIGGRWYFLDATWDAGYIEGDSFVPEYGTTYLFTPPEVMSLSHFPEDDKWQLRDPAISRADWLRLPLVRPAFMGLGLALVSPLTPVVSAGKSIAVTIDNPGRVELGLYYYDAEGTSSRVCATSSDARAALSCDVPDKGRYTAHIAARLDPTTRSYRSLGALLVDASP